MAVYKRFTIQQKYLNGVPQEEYRLGMEYDPKAYHSMENCESGTECTQVEYRWIDVEGEYICEDTTKYAKQKRQQKCVDEEEWVDMYPYQYQKGEMLEEDSKVCGGIHYLITDTDGNGELTYDPIKSEYTSKESVLFMATPNEGYLFSCYMIGSTSKYGEIVNDSVMRLTMSNDWYVKALFKTQMFTLNTSVISGIGSIGLSPKGGQYSRGQRVYITATPNESYLFNGFVHGSYSWSRPYSTGENPMYVDMYSDYWVDAKFKPNPEYVNCLEWGYHNGDVFVSCEPFNSSLNWAHLAQWAYGTTSVKYRDGLKYVKDKNGQITQLDDCAFSSCHNLESVYFPQVEVIPISAFAWTTSLNSFSMPIANYVQYSAFIQCGLSIISLPNVSSFRYHSRYSTIFGGNGKLKDLYLPYQGVVSQFDTPNFYWGCNSEFLIHVPDSLVSTYKEICGTRSVYLSGLTKPLSDCIVGLDPLYRIYPKSVDNCDLIVTPSKSLYSYGDVVTITPSIADGYSLTYFMYGSDSYYSQTLSESQLTVSMVNDLYVKPSVTLVDYGNMLYLEYSTGAYTWVSYNSTTLASINPDDSQGWLVMVSDFGEGIYSIGGSAFYSRTPLKSIYFPSCKTIGVEAFRYCLSLQTVNLPLCEYVGDKAFANCILLPSIDLPLCSYIGNSAFDNCHSLQTVNLPLCEYVGSYAFYYCSSLLSIDLPMCSYIGNNAFAVCYELNTVKLPLCEYVGDGAFRYCSALLSINLPLCEHIGERAFEFCSSLSNVTCSKLSYISLYAFYNLSNLEHVDLDNVSYVGRAAFYGCGKLTNINLPNVESVESGAFTLCVGIDKLDLPVCHTISTRGFYNCGNISYANIPQCVSLGSSAFYFCTNLETIRLDNVSKVPTLGDGSVFYGTNLKSIYVPTSLYKDFLSSSYWYRLGSSKFISV